MTIICNVGRYGGFSVHRGDTTRLCLGWLAITIIPADLDNVLGRLTRIEVAARAYVAAWDAGDTMAHEERGILRKALETKL
jgi:hypothetical protein